MMLSWDERGTLVPVSSLEELEQLLDQVSAEAAERGSPLMVTMLDEDDPAGPALSIGCGAEYGVAVWHMPDRDPPSMVSRGKRADKAGKVNKAGKADKAVSFRFCGEPTEYEPGTLIPNEQAREAMRGFFGSGSRPDSVTWS